MLIVKTEEGLKYFKDLWMQKSGGETIADKELVPLKKFYRVQVLITDKGQQFLESISIPHTIQELVIPKVPHYEPKMGITKLTSLRATKEHGNPSPSMDRFVPPVVSSSKRRDDNYAELEVEIFTGRTHQIRYHLSRHGLPVRGDYLYMDKKDYNENDIMHLQAYRLQFLDIEGEMMDVECERSW